MSKNDLRTRAMTVAHQQTIGKFRHSRARGRGVQNVKLALLASLRSKVWDYFLNAYPGWRPLRGLIRG